MDPTTPMPSYLRGHERWAIAWARNHGGTWPGLPELDEATYNWWNTMGNEGREGYKNLPGVRAAAEGYRPTLGGPREGGRLPGLAEMPFALAQYGAGGVGREPDVLSPDWTAPVESVLQQIAPILQGAGAGTFRSLANRLAMDYATIEAQNPGKPGIGFADFIRTRLPAMLFGRETTGVPAQAGGVPANVPTGVTWQEIQAAGPGSAYSGGGEAWKDSSQRQMYQNAVQSAYMKQFAPFAQGDVYSSMLDRLGALTKTFPGVSTAGSPESYADYLARSMKGFI